MAMLYCNEGMCISIYKMAINGHVPVSSEVNLSEGLIFEHFPCFEYNGHTS